VFAEGTRLLREVGHHPQEPTPWAKHPNIEVFAEGTRLLREGGHHP
jgi:hypothetical protein